MTTQAEAHLLQWLKKNTSLYQYRLDKNWITLNDLASQKQIAFDVRKITNYREKAHPQQASTYFNMVLDGEKEIVLTHAGLAFSPVFHNTGPLPDAPPVTCLADYHMMVLQLNALLQEAERKKEALLLFQVLISILDGAKNIGLEVGLEEEQLEKKLTEFEESF